MHHRHRQTRQALTVALAALLGVGAAATAHAIGEGEESGADPASMVLGGMLMFYNTSAPLSFVAMTAKDLPPGARLLGRLNGVSCQYGISIPLSLSPQATSISAANGDGSLDKAFADIRKKNPGVAGFYDTMVDLHSTTILGVWKRKCTLISTLAFAKD